MKTLFISTYNELITIGLLRDGNLLVEQEHQSERSHSSHLVPLIEQVLKTQGLTPQALDEIIVVNGPGSFTGVRLGITVAKTLAYTLNIPIKTITSIEALALSTSVTTKKLVNVDDAKGSYYGVFENNTLQGEINYLKIESFRQLLAENKWEDLVQSSLSKLSLEAIYQYLKNKGVVSAHHVQAIYIKTIEVENDK